MKNHYPTINRRNLLEIMPANSLAIFFASEKCIRKGDTEYPYAQNSNFYYLTGYDYPDAILLMYRSESQALSMLFVAENSKKQTSWFGHRPSLFQTRRITGVEFCLPTKDFSFELSRFIHAVNICYIDYPLIPFDRSLTQPLRFLEQFKRRYPHIRTKCANELLAKLRRRKNKLEINRIRKAIQITKQGLLSMMQHVKPGVFEYELEAFFKFELMMNHCPVAFNPIIATGKNATILHYSDKTSKLRRGELVLFDVGAEYRYYSADISRTIPVDGVFSSFQRSIYNIVLAANKVTIESIVPGITLAKLQETANNILAEGLLRLNILKKESDLSRYFFHGVSHAVGLDTHDIPIQRTRPLEPGEIITVEPGLYLPEEKIGIRIEDDILITENGYENLSAGIPKEVSDIEKIMMTS